MAALKTHHAMRALGEPIDHFAFAFIAPLSAHDNDITTQSVFSGLHCVSARSPYELASGSPPSLRDGGLLRSHRSPYCLCACSLCKLAEKRSEYAVLLDINPSMQS